MILTIYNSKSDIVVFWHKYSSENTSTSNKWSTNIKIRSVETTDTSKILSKTVILLYIITETVRFNYIRSSRRQVPREIQP